LSKTLEAFSFLLAAAQQIMQTAKALLLLTTHEHVALKRRGKVGDMGSQVTGFLRATLGIGKI
jgi:hypothetical protein